MYIDAYFDRKSDIIHVAERRNGQRILLEIPPPYVFYHEDASGLHRSIYGHPCKRFTTTSGYKFHSALKEKRNEDRQIFESDINPVFRMLATNYSNSEIPVLHLGVFDIEAAFDTERGFAPSFNPFNAITAITLYRSADNRLLSFILKPSTLSFDEAQEIAKTFDDTILYDDEQELLLAFLDAMEDVDLLTGWSSSQYDIPYLVNRIKKIINPKTAKRLCLWDQSPTPREYNDKFGRTVKTYDLIGRNHIDYIDLYAKHTPKQHLSYGLNAIAMDELGKTKVPYTGTLDDLYHKEFKKFIDYNRQDVMLIVEIDNQLKYIELANHIAHSNCVLFKTTIGSVALVEQAVINEMHAMGYVVPDRKARDTEDDIDDIEESHTPVVGAYVADPKLGLQNHIGCVDIGSEYPSTIRALNMSPETLIGQVRLTETMQLISDKVAKLTKTQRAEAWDGIFSTNEVQHMHAQDNTKMIIDFFDHIRNTTKTVEMTGKQLYDYVYDAANAVCISANGTIFRTDVDGMIPMLLGKWYSERKEFQAQQKMHKEQGNKELSQHYNFLNLAAKIRLNIVYGSILNPVCRFNDDRIGQSTTLSGRCIVQHMNAKINEIITGEYDYRGKAIIYADTDSCYFSIDTWKDDPNFNDFDWSRENIINLYDLIADETNKTFSEFMQTTFNTTTERSDLIRASRELVASKGLFAKKKKYALLMYDKEGERLDVDGKPGSLKVMGLDLKRSDTPKVMQQFLESLLMDILTDVPQQQMFENIKTFRQTFKMQPGWEKGSPKKVANLAAFTAKMVSSIDREMSTLNRSENLRINLPGHVRASMNWNQFCEHYKDHNATRITDSSRIVVCKLRSNTMGMTSIAYPVDELLNLPSWFRELPFDDEAMEETIIDNKIMNLCSVLNWDLASTKESVSDQFFAFETN